MAAGNEDELVLDAIFNPSLQGAAVDDAAKNCTECNEDEGIEAGVLENVKRLEVEAVRAAENGDYEESLKIFNNAINIAPSHASTFNNRAQLYRLQGDLEFLLQVALMFAKNAHAPQWFKCVFLLQVTWMQR